MRKLFLAALLAISPVTFADTLEHVEEEVHMALETIQALKAEINELKATVAMQGEVQEASMSRIAKAAKKFEKVTLGGYGELHYQDVDNLMNVIYKLRDSGSTILIVEHNLDVINCSDYIIDLGPEGGERGGYLQFMGQREDFISSGSGETLNYLKKHISWKRIIRGLLLMRL